MPDVKRIAAQQIHDASPGTLFRQVLASQGIGVSEAATKLGSNQSSVSQMLADTRPISHDMARRIEELFGVPAYVLARLRFERDFAVGKTKSANR